MPNELVVARAHRRGAELYVALKAVLQDTQHNDHDCRDPGCPILLAKRLIGEIEWAPPYKGKGDAT